jgi:poly(hydroxyalkanoate) depolymerase family esterase
MNFMKKSSIFTISISSAALFCSQALAKSEDQWLQGSATANTTLKYQLFVPGSSNPNPQRPLVVALAGCSQSGSELDGISGLSKLAQKENFAVLFPEQSPANNTLRCWNWFEKSQQSRDGKEVKTISQMIDQVVENYGFNPSQIYLVGFSAGAAMTQILSSCYPEKFAGALLHSGLAFGSAVSMVEAYTAMSVGSSKPVASLAQAATNCALPNNTKMVPTFVVHGTADYTVNFKNGTQTMDQLLEMARLQRQKNPSSTPEIKKGMSGILAGKSLSGQLQSYETTTGNVVFQTLWINGLAHAWSGGGPGKYSNPSGPNALGAAWEFFMSQGE